MTASSGSVDEQAFAFQGADAAFARALLPRAVDPVWTWRRVIRDDGFELERAKPAAVVGTTVTFGMISPTFSFVLQCSIIARLNGVLQSARARSNGIDRVELARRWGHLPVVLVVRPGSWQSAIRQVPPLIVSNSTEVQLPSSVKAVGRWTTAALCGALEPRRWCSAGRIRPPDATIAASSPKRHA
jgi:hypothetical protein